MPSFKPKPVKKIKINKKNSTTLDGKHKEFLNEFNKDEHEHIPKLKEERQELLDKMSSQVDLERKLDMQDRIDEITKKLSELKRKKNDYFLENSKYIFEYFENKKSISKTETNTTTNLTTKNKVLHSFFKINTEPVVQNDQMNKNIVRKYLCNIDETFLDVNNYLNATNFCSYCQEGELIPLDDEGVLICNSCFKNAPYLIENEKPSYKEPPKEVCFYAYKKINHFKEILAQFQGKETTQIPAEVIENIKQQIKKERVKIEELSYTKLKEMLKKLSYNKFYEHIQFIKNKLGITPPVFTPEFEETLCNLFNELLSPYSKFCPNDRVNFLNYYYVLFKLCELLGESRYLHEIPMLKDREKIIEQDEIWKHMCTELNWVFIATI